MKKALLLLFLLLGICQVKAQDLIVKNNNDSLRCKVIKQGEETVFYFTYDSSKNEITNAIKKSEIKGVFIDYYAVKKSENSINTISNTRGGNTVNSKPRRKVEIIPGYRFSANYGAAYWIFLNPKNTNAFVKEYLNDLRTGNAYSFTFNYYGKNNYGFGLQYMTFMSYNREENVMLATPGITPTYGTLIDDIEMKYIGVSFGFRMPLENKKWRVLGDVGIGYSDYVNNTEFGTKAKISTSTVGLNTQFGLDCKISKTLSWGITGTLIRANVNSYEVSTGTTKTTVKLPDGESDSHMRADISVGLRINIE